MSKGLTFEKTFVFIFIAALCYALINSWRYPNNNISGSQQLVHENIDGLDKFIYQIKENSKDDLPHLYKADIQIKMGGFYFSIGSVATMYPYGPGAFYILVDIDFYKTLTLQEKKAMVAHEMGHVAYPNSPKFPTNILVVINSQIQADTFATKYVSPDDVVSLIKKAADFNLEYKLRLDNLNKIKQGRTP